MQTASKRDKQTKLIIGKIETVLRQINNGKSVGRAYSFCKVLEDDTLNIKILILKNDDHNFTTVAVRIKNNWYHFNPANTYVGLYRLKKMGKDKFVNLPSGKEYTIIAEYTPEEYIKYYEESVKQTKVNSYGKIF